MAMRLGMLKAGGVGNPGCSFGLLKWIHSAAISPAFEGSLPRTVAPPQVVLPEFDRTPDNGSGNYNNFLEFGFPSFSFGGSMELMAVPKRKVSPHKRGIRNGPKALKPVPVIIRCRTCGKVKLPHFYCCSGVREKTGDQNN